MADPLGPLRPGDRLPTSARTWNPILDATRAFKRHEQDRGGKPLTTGRSGDLVKVFNDSGVDLGRRSVLGIAGPAFLPSEDEDAFLQEVSLSGVVPDATHVGKFAILLEPAADGRLARAFVAGVVQVRVDVVDPAHQYADIDVGETAHLITADAGAARILWREGGEAGVEWAIVRFNPTCGGSDSYYGDYY